MTLVNLIRTQDQLACNIEGVGRNSFQYSLESFVCRTHPTSDTYQFQPYLHIATVIAMLPTKALLHPDLHDKNSLRLMAHMHLLQNHL